MADSTETTSIFIYNLLGGRELTSGQSQWSKDACRKHLAAGLYFREASSARPETQIIRTH